jgi:hypothetical protein
MTIAVHDTVFESLDASKEEVKRITALLDRRG